MTADVIIAATGIVSVLTAGAAVFYTLKGVRDQLWLQTFAEYTRRYADIVQALPSESRRPGGTFALEKLETGARGEVMNAVRGYLNLCSEEYYLHDRGRIDHETWEIWSAGMEETFRLPWLRLTWPLLLDEYSYVSGFPEFVDRCIARGDERFPTGGKGPRGTQGRH